MPGFEKVRKNLEAHGFDVTCFDTAAEAADYLDRRLDGKTVGHGGSITLKELGLLERLQSHAVVRSHWLGDSFADAAAAPVYLTSVNALAETGELINIDGTGNRVASTIFGHEASTSWPPTTTPPCGGPATWPPPKTPGGWAKRLPAPSGGTNAMTAKARSASAAPWRCCGRGPPASAGPRWCWSTSLWATEERRAWH